jgi:hypothetical protein
MEIILNPKIDNAPAINAVIAAASNGDKIIFPPGSFPIHAPILITGKTIRLEGDNTTIATSLNTSALVVKGGSIKPTKIIGIDFVNYYHSPDSNADGLQISGIVHMEDCWIKGFGGNGISVTADLGTYKTNASFSSFRNLLISANKKHGMYFQGGDANQCNCYHIDVRDNAGYGIYDHSFLGNQFFGCMAHNNGAKVLSNYCADDPNNRAGFFGCYSEQGSAPEMLCGAATWHGGLPANGFKLASWAKVYINVNSKYQ